ncbi:MAG: DUF3822 family protein [Chryseobacterium sp.]|nr:MAG: DUF3822 family protein [Chryseobacterium sp.]
MQKLLFTKDGLQWTIGKGQSYRENSVFRTEDTAEDFVAAELNEALKAPARKIEVISAFNHFTMMPYGFDNHDLAYKLISYNAPVNADTEELMLAVNKRYHVQFYYTLPKEYYRAIKARNIPTTFNFSGEKFLQQLSSAKARHQVHINLYPTQAEFFALDDRRIVLYNNLDATSEVDFLYFIMFSVSKIGFPVKDTQFVVYGELSGNETFLSELQKFAPHVKVAFQNEGNKKHLMF